MMAIAPSRRLPFQAAVLAAAFSAVFAMPLAAQGREGAFDRTLSVTGAVDLDVRSGSGAIRVQPGEAGSVRISARIKADNSWFAGSDVEQRIRRIEQTPPIEQQGNAIRVGRFTDDSVQRGISISYDITVPADTKLGASTGSGSITIGEIKGPADAKSGSGSVTIARVAGPVTASTGSGSIKVDGAAGLDAHTGSGSIHAAAIAGPAKASSGSGSITVTQAGPGGVEASTSSGGITVSGVNGPAHVNASSGSIEIDGRPAGPWSVHSSSGGVTITLPPDAAFDLDARTSSGSIESVHPVTMTLTGNVDKRHIQGKVRGGGPLVEVSCSSGSIRIR